MRHRPVAIEDRNDQGQLVVVVGGVVTGGEKPRLLQAFT
jgi:hypothetical protein